MMAIKSAMLLIALLAGYALAGYALALAGMPHWQGCTLEALYVALAGDAL